jgi:hypothetical protein
MRNFIRVLLIAAFLCALFARLALNSVATRSRSLLDIWRG